MPSIVRLSMLAVVSALLASCQNGQKSSSNDPYVANFGNDGAYHPYPGQSGTMQSGGATHPSTPTYTAPPTTPAPAQTDPYAFSGPSTASSKPSSSVDHTTSSSSGSKPKPKGTSSSSSTASTKPKPKSGSSSTASTASSSSPKPKTAAKSGTKKPASSSGSYKVVQGDTLYGIAIKKHTSVAKLKSANHLTSDLIRPGMVFKIP